jgi:hypothetical protein
MKPEAGGKRWPQVEETEGKRTDTDRLIKPGGTITESRRKWMEAAQGGRNRRQVDGKPVAHSKTNGT